MGRLARRVSDLRAHLYYNTCSLAALAERRIIVDYRPGLVRLSPYFYNTAEDGDRVIQAIADLERAGIS